MGKPETTPLKRTASSASLSSTSTASSLSDESAFLADDSLPQPRDTVGMNSGEDRYRDIEDGEGDPEEPFLPVRPKKASGSRSRRVLWVLGMLCVGGWALAFLLFVTQGHGTASTAATATTAYDPDSATGSTNYGRPVTLDQVLGGEWSARRHAISWIAGPNGEDGLLVERGEGGDKGYLRVEDIRSRKEGAEAAAQSRVLMKDSFLRVGDRMVAPSDLWPSPDMESVLIVSDRESNWRHSFFGKYWILDVKTQTAQPLDPSNTEGRIQLALWAPTSDAVVFVRDNNMYLRNLASTEVIPITKDGGEDYFYGVPDWVYEEEVFAGRSVTWWSSDGKYIAFLQTNESTVPEYPVQYFLSRPSGTKPLPGLENYPEVRQIKYPKSGAPNPVVALQFYDVAKNEVFSVDIPGDFADDDRIIIEVLWASKAKVLVRETNRESDVLKLFLIDTESRSAKLVRSDDVAGLDGGWVEPTQSTRFIPANPERGRPDDGYIDTVIHEGYDHLAYFTPLDNPNPIMLTSGEWEVVNGPSAVDLERDLVYFVATKQAPTERHVYRVKLDGSGFQALTETSKAGYYGASFSHGAGYALVSYQGPSVPWQSLISTQGAEAVTEEVIEENPELSRKVKEYALPIEIYQNVTIDGYTFQVVERRPPHFNPAMQYPVLFHLYGGPGSQTVDRKFTVDFQSYVASNLGYIVVTVDGRGTGYIGRKARCSVRGNLGYYEAHDQIETAKIWASKKYVDETRMAIWGWSFGGFMTLKTLEQDAGETFQYGMAVAPVTDWQFYDSVYTERYMHTPQHNPEGYANSTISDMSALQKNTRFLVMHGVSDDNVHFQNTLALLDKLDLASVENYDVHFFPDSDHSIYFHNGHTMVYERLASWLINAFNGEWHRIANPTPDDSMWARVKRAFSLS
ncbi:hypothetical protein ASPZODRAFT_62926 [Penicilliopsis zonata CBS 506.65]|uniref:dipeptidyl-peptidase IV n=1 Tax=Penicilliopsis zonata CBS 506.65 TaxID=1073090 RepID=A0A1L9SMB7_9EURO|nr:hypothetical protein ASPZODRAFT_62926 [Penicilliopsis zonata CBS 506.65]OJJ48187.1 hypothetical protein ASPZODRAFT_62926 [Penicilliopsis zonata CBS 506.65]